jgi:hypothetical protein
VITPRRASTRNTFAHISPRAVGTFRAFSSAAIGLVEVAQKAHDETRFDAERSAGVGDGATQTFDDGRERDAARCVALRVEEHLDVAHVVGVRALEIGPRQGRRNPVP